MKTLIAICALLLLSVGTVDAQRGKGNGASGRGGTPPGSSPPPGVSGTIPGRAPVAAPEFDPESAGAVLVLLIGGCLVLLDTRAGRQTPDR